MGTSTRPPGPIATSSPTGCGPAEWTQLWTTLRNAVALLSGSDPALALLALDMADDDPLAAEMDTEARSALDDLRSRLVAALDEQQVRQVRVERRLTDRVELATRVRAALAAR